MSRGGLLLRHAGEGAELDYVPVAGAVRHGARPPKLPPLRPSRRSIVAAGTMKRPAGKVRAGDAAASPPAKRRRAFTIPRDQDNVVVRRRDGEVRLTNLRKVFWPELGLTKGDLLQYYADVADVLLPHLRDRAMVMKRYPHGAAGEFFFMKRAPSPRPDWIRDLLDRARVGQRHRLSDDSGSRVAAVGGQSRLHRSEPVVRAVRRRRSPGLPAFRSRSRRRRRVRPRARDRADRPRGARRL